MFFRQNLHVDATIRAAMANIGISQFKDFANYSAGALVSRPSKRQVRTFFLDVAGQRKKYFLKQAGWQSAQEVLKAWCRFQRPCSNMARELLIIQLFRDHGIPVMNPVAWGERKFLGVVHGWIYVGGGSGRKRICGGLSSGLITISPTFDVGPW